MGRASAEPSRLVADCGSCQYLNEANEALHECRYALKFTYVYAFYLPEKHNFRVHFEM